MDGSHEIHLQTALIIHYAVQFRNRVVGTQNDRIQPLGEPLKFPKIRGGGTKHEIEIQCGHRRTMNCRGRIPDQDRLQAHLCQSSHNRVQ